MTMPTQLGTISLTRRFAMACPFWGILLMLRLSQRTYDLMERALAVVDDDAAELITTLVASAFVDGRGEAVAELGEDQDTEKDE